MGKLLCASAHIVIYDSKMIVCWCTLHVYIHFQCRPHGDISDSKNQECKILELGFVPTQNYATKAILLQSNTVVQIELLLNTEYKRTIMEVISSPYT